MNDAGFVFYLEILSKLNFSIKHKTTLLGAWFIKYRDLARITTVILIKLPPDNEKYASQKKRCTFFVPDSLQKLGLLTVSETKKSALPCRLFALSDLARIQTWNLLSRNQVRYSVAPQGRFYNRNKKEK